MKTLKSLLLLSLVGLGFWPARQYRKQGKVRALALISRERNPALPKVRHPMIPRGADPAFLGAKLD